uniref:(northern house mosquito) hypothetical protein n=1 Tax=Culex pipiens TaxID=7175 RepID=A0A8D8C0G7_CULPI
MFMSQNSQQLKRLISTQPLQVDQVTVFGLVGSATEPKPYLAPIRLGQAGIQDVEHVECRCVHAGTDQGESFRFCAAFGQVVTELVCFIFEGLDCVRIIHQISEVEIHKFGRNVDSIWT